jgi:hypothetical protein
MYARRDGERIRVYCQDGSPFFTFYQVSTIAEQLVQSELTILERVLFKQVFEDCIGEIPIPRRLKKQVAMKLMEIELDKTI